MRRKQSMTYQDALDFKRTWDQHQGKEDVIAETIGTGERTVRNYRRTAEEILGCALLCHREFVPTNFPVYQNHIFNQKKDYTILIGSDRHAKPGHTPAAFKCFLEVAADIKPDVVLINGDFFDFPTIGRHHRIGWEYRPTVEEELEDGINCLEDIKKAAPKAKRFFNLGNHDMRFDGFISNNTPEMEGVKGQHLEDYLQGWKIGLSVVFNDVFIAKHRWHSGVHSGYNDAVKGGVNIVTGHDHKLSVRPITDYSGMRYGIKCGTLSDLYDSTFLYTENAPTDWQPGFVVVDVSEDIIVPHACPVVIKKTHPKYGKTRFGGKWYG